jgi:hypothetical protein
MPGAPDGDQWLLLPELAAPPVRAVVEDDHLGVWDSGGSLHVFRTAAGEPEVRLVGRVDPEDGVSPLAFTHAPQRETVGFSDGAVASWSSGFSEPQEGVALSSPILGMVETHETLLVATSAGVFSGLMTPVGSAELHLDAVRFSDNRLSILPGGAAAPEGGVRIRMWGTGLDGGGASAGAFWETPEALTDPWGQVDLTVPSEVGGVHSISWTEGEVLAEVGGGAESFDLPDLAPRPPFPDRACTRAGDVCDADLVAVGTAWRAWATAGRDTVHVRFTDGSWWYDEVHAVTGVRGLAATPAGDRLLIAADRLWVVEGVDNPFPSFVEIDPFAAPVGGVVAVDDSSALVVAAADLRVARVDLASGTVMPPGVVTLLDGAGAVVDVTADVSSTVWLLTAGPGRVVRLAPDTLTVVSSADAWGYFRSIAVGLIDDPMYGEPFDGLLLLEQDPEGGYATLEVRDAAFPADEPREWISVPPFSRDLLVADCPDGSSRVLIASGLAAGVSEVVFSDDWWQAVDVADHGDVRALALAAAPFHDGAEVPETCTAVRDLRTKVGVGDGCGERLYALTEAGPVPVEADLCPCEDDPPSALVDWNAIELDLSGCQPVLRAAAGAVVGPEPITIQVDVENDPDSTGYLPWSADPLDIASGEAFAVPLSAVEVESVIRMTATPAGADPISQVVDEITWSRPLEIDEGLVEVTVADGVADVSVAFDALSWRLEHAYVEVYGDTEYDWTNGTCPDAQGPYELSLPVAPDEELWLWACVGTDEDICAPDLLIYPLRKRLPGDGPVPE